MIDHVSRLSRRRFLQATGGAAGWAISGAATGAFPTPAIAQPVPIRIGHQCDLTGALASTGYWRKKATDAAAKWLNDRGGIAGRPIEVITVDTETKVDVGVLRMRHLVQEEGVDFVIGSEHGGVGIASNEIAQERRTLYLSLSRTDAVTGRAANPFVFRLMVNTSLAANSTGPSIIEKTGQRWAILYADYVWGESNRDAWATQVERAGGAVAQTVAMPVNSPDPLSYIAKLDRSVDAIFVALLAPDMPRAVTALNQMGLGEKHIVTADAIFGVFDVLGLGSAVEGVWGMDSIPWELADHDTPHLRTMRDAVGLDEHGREVGTGRFSIPGDVWPAWENLGFLKQNVEGSGWEGPDDTEALIAHAEANPEYPEGELFPQGPLTVRPEDHQAFCQYYVLRIEDERIRVVERRPRDAGMYPPPVDLTAG